MATDDGTEVWATTAMVGNSPQLLKLTFTKAEMNAAKQATRSGNEAESKVGRCMMQTPATARSASASTAMGRRWPNTTARMTMTQMGLVAMTTITSVTGMWVRQ